MHTYAHFRLLVMASMLVAASFVTQAQSRQAIVAPQEGFWVIEIPAKTHQSIVRFYTSNHQLIYEETLNQALNIARSKTKRQLNTALEQALFVWNATHRIPTDRQWVAVQFEKNH